MPPIPEYHPGLTIGSSENGLKIDAFYDLTC